MKIRRAEKKDLADVARIHVEAWKSVYRGIMPDEVLDARNLDAQQIVWEEELDKGAKLYVCEQEGNIVGFASGHEVDAFHGEIDTLYFQESDRGKGYGLQMLDYMRHVLGEEKQISLWCVKENPNRTFYEANGGETGLEKTVQIGGKEIAGIQYLFEKPRK